MDSWTRLAVLSVALLFAPVALASSIPLHLDIPQGQIFLNAGGLFSVSGRPWGTAVGTGAELSVHGFFRGRKRLGLGVFGQWQSMNGHYDRFGGGVQGTHGFVGMELGMAHESASNISAATTSLHMAPFVSLGVVTASFRVGIPINRASGDKPGQGFDIGLVLALKLPLLKFKGAL